MPPRPSPDRLSLSDWMLLIGANAFSIAGFILVDDRLYDGGRYLFGIFQWPDGPWPPKLYLEKAQGVFAALASTFGAWTLVLPLIGLRRPRRARLRLFRTPGLSACVGACVGMLFCVLAPALALAIRRLDGPFAAAPGLWYGVPAFEGLFILAGVGVAATWAEAWMAGRWRASANAIDRIGRVVGLSWLAAGLVFAARLYLG